MRVFDPARLALALLAVVVIAPAHAVDAPPDPNHAKIVALAKAAPRGAFPRAYLGEQNYWTLVGTPDGGPTALMDEGGAVELWRGGPSIEPFVIEDGKTVTWAGVQSSQSLEAGWMPVPSVTWTRPDWRLETTAIATGKELDETVVLRYTLTSTSSRPLTLRLGLALRPFQVNPPQQFLNLNGGSARVECVGWDGDVLDVDQRSLLSRPLPNRVGLRRLADGLALSETGGVFKGKVCDPSALASATLSYDIELRPGERRSVRLLAPLDQYATLGTALYIRQARQRPPIPPGDAELADVARSFRAMLDRLRTAQFELPERSAPQLWERALASVELTVPRDAHPLADTLRTALAHILMSRGGPTIVPDLTTLDPAARAYRTSLIASQVGPMLRPGTRSYARSWIRDGAMMAESLVRLGRADVAWTYLEAYAPYQLADGRIPCCVDARGGDPTHENDSDGEFLHLAALVHDHAPDPARLAKLWPNLTRAADHIETMRQSTRTPANRGTPYHGLLPPSISHEGYSDKPAYSYWDDFWALLGLKDAARLAAALNRPQEARELDARARAFRIDILASIAAARAKGNLPHIPGAADRLDFDATSTSIALRPADEGDALPRDALEATFDRYYRDITTRARRTDWEAYVPYEWRNVGALVRLGQRERAWEVAQLLIADRRPLGWNGWAEVVIRQPRRPTFLGDMPHAWVASDFINSALDLFAYERGRDGAIVLAAGVPAAWFRERFGVTGLSTPHGRLTYRIDGGRISYALDGRAPPGGLVLALPSGEVRLPGTRGDRPIPSRN